MKIIRDLNNYNSTNYLSASIGAFDGIHFGHSKIIEDIKLISKENNTKSALITFYPIPKIFFGEKKYEIYNISEKIKLISDFNIDYLFLLRFNKSLSSMESIKFIEEILLNKLKVKNLLVGKDFKFGKNQDGDIRTLNKYYNTGQRNLHIIGEYKINGLRVSTTNIRELISENKFDEVEKLLGRRYSVSGKIIHGENLGKKLGFPTANIKFESELLDGVYAVKTKINNKLYQAVANIGFKPTLKGKKYQFEAHILNFNQDLYGRHLSFDIIKKIRNTKKFNNLDELKGQINKDIELAKKHF